MATYGCPNCGKTFSVPDWLATGVKCPTCATPAKKVDTAQADSEKPKFAGSPPKETPQKPRDKEPRSDVGEDVLSVPSSATVKSEANRATTAATASSMNTSTQLQPKISFRRRMMGQNKFALFGSIGALGCFIGALLGEILLASTYVAPPATSESAQPKPQAVCLLIDCSGSMHSLIGTSKLDEVKDAAKRFVQSLNVSENSIAVIGFGNSVHVGTRLSGDLGDIKYAIDQLDDGGSTNMSAGLSASTAELNGTSLPRNVLLFTDGMPNSQEATLAAAQACRDQEMKIIAIATDDADTRYLAQVTGDPSLVIPTSSGNFGKGFSQASKVIYGRSLVESDPSAGSFGQKLLRVAGWTALLAFGVSMALIAGQNLYLGRRFLKLSEGVVGMAGGLAAGFVAGAAGQILFAPVATISFLQAIGTVVGWAVLGAFVGRGMAFFVPNLPARRAFAGGGIGGAIGATAFLLAAEWLSDIVGRLLGAAILGLVLGLLIAIIEAAFRKAWLEVSYGPNEVVTVNLGEKPITIGSDSKACTLFAFNAPPVALCYTIVGGEIMCEDVIAETTTTVQPGNQQTVGDVTVTVHAAGS